VKLSNNSSPDSDEQAYEEYTAKSDEEILTSSIEYLTDDERERLDYINRAKLWGWYEPFRLEAPDISGLMAEKKIIPEEEILDAINFTKEQEDALKKILLDNWDTLTKGEKEIYHYLNGTLPRWGKIYLPPHEFIQTCEEFMNKKPENQKMTEESLYSIYRKYNI
jgi:hypothetical protein